MSEGNHIGIIVFQYSIVVKGIERKLNEYGFKIDIISNREIIYQARNRQLIKDTDNGREIQIRIDELKLLLEAYRNGKLKEKR